MALVATLCGGCEAWFATQTEPAQPGSVTAVVTETVGPVLAAAARPLNAGDGPALDALGVTTADALPTQDIGGQDTDAVETDGSDAAAGADSFPPFPPAKIAWGECPNVTMSEKLNCGTMPVPLDWSKPNGKKLTISVWRVPALYGGISNLWLLNGGPGGSGYSLMGMAAHLQAALPTTDLYFPDHRGTGPTARLDCPIAESQSSPDGAGITIDEMPLCAQALSNTWGKDLDHFTTQAAARDVVALMKAMPAPGKRSLMGISYGTYWAIRVMALAPDVADAVVLDSICPPGICQTKDYNPSHDVVAKQYMQACAKDPICGKHLGEDPWAVLTGLSAKFADGHCSAAGSLADWSELRFYFGSLIQWMALRPLVPALVHRLNRCSTGDLAALKHFLAYAKTNWGSNGLPGNGELHNSGSLGVHIRLSELSGNPPSTSKEIMDASKNAVVIANDGVWYAKVNQIWPRYPYPAEAAVWKPYKGSVLLVNGTYDPQTPVAWAELGKSVYNAPGQHVVLFPGIAHGIYYAAKTPSGVYCGREVIASYLLNGKPNAACIQNINQPVYHMEQGWALALLGTHNLWDNPSKSDSLATGLPNPAAIVALRKALSDRLWPRLR